MTLQDIIAALQRYWAERGCLIHQPWDAEVGAGTMHPETFLRVLGPDPWRVAYVQPASGYFAQWGGNYLWFCHSSYGGAFSDSGGYTIRMGCMGNGGVSGGPWYTNYAGGWKYIASVNSTCFHSTMHCNLSPGAYSEELRGPYFNNDTIELYKLARSLVAN